MSRYIHSVHRNLEEMQNHQDVSLKDRPEAYNSAITGLDIHFVFKRIGVSDDKHSVAASLVYNRKT